MEDGHQYASLTQAEFKAFVDANVWVYAKSMPRTPHEYVLAWKATSQETFYRAVMTIRRFGFDEQYRTMLIRYSEIGGNKYWTMGEFLETTWVLNRARLFRPEHPWSPSTTEFKPKKGRPMKGKSKFLLTRKAVAIRVQ